MRESTYCRIQGQLSRASGHSLSHEAVFLGLTDKGNAVVNTK